MAIVACITAPIWADKDSIDTTRCSSFSLLISGLSDWSPCGPPAKPSGTIEPPMSAAGMRMLLKRSTAVDEKSDRARTRRRRLPMYFTCRRLPFICFVA
eukprot:scaffold17187_cov43-Prasinocladus_malaysianus.AAC.2